MDLKFSPGKSNKKQINKMYRMSESEKYCEDKMEKKERKYGYLFSLNFLFGKCLKNSTMNSLYTALRLTNY